MTGITEVTKEDSPPEAEELHTLKSGKITVTNVDSTETELETIDVGKQGHDFDTDDDIMLR